MWAGKSWANGDELVILTSPCPASRNSLDLCALVSTLGDSAVQKERGEFRHQMRGRTRQCFPNGSDGGAHQVGCSGGGVLVYWLKIRFPGPLTSISREEAWEAEF